MAKELKIGLAVLLSILGVLAAVSIIGNFAQRNFAIKGVTKDKTEVQTRAKAIAGSWTQANLDAFLGSLH